MQRRTTCLLMKVKRDRTRKVCVVNFLGVGKGEIWEGMGRVGSGLISLFGRRMSYAPSLLSRLGVGMRGGQLFWGVHGVEKWLWTFGYGAA